MSGKIPPVASITDILMEDEVEEKVEEEDEILIEE